MIQGTGRRSATIGPPAELPDPPLPLLITGTAGVAGFQAYHYFARRFPGQVVATRRPDNWRLDGPGIVDCSPSDPAEIARLFDQYQFRSVLNAEGHCRLKACECDPQLAHRANAGAAQALVEVATGTGVRIVHLSIDLVFSGLHGAPYTEQDPPDPVTAYGHSMWEAEQIFQSYQDCCILRISLPMGRSFNGHAGAIDWIESRFRKGRPATLYFDEIRTPHYADCLNRLCHDLLNRDLIGTYHAGGPAPLSLFQIAQVINRVGGYPPELLRGCPRTHAGPIPPRAGDVRLDSSRLAAALGYAPMRSWPSEPDWVPRDPAWHRDRPLNSPGSPQLVHDLLCRSQPSPQ